MEGIQRLAPEVELRVVGQGFVGIIDDDKPFEEHQEAARQGLAEAREILKSQAFSLIILDELNVAIQLNLLTREEVEKTLDTRSDKQHVVITGRSAPDWLIDQADLVTEMREIKHYYQPKVPARSGIEK